MTIRNAHFYNRNEGIAYPLDDNATCLADDGTRLPADILVDLNLRWPDYLGHYAFLAGVAVTPGLVTVTFQAARSPDDDAFAPLAVLTVVQPVARYRVYALRPQAPGVGGWAVFGAGAAPGAAYRGRYGSPRQGLLAPRAARAYRAPPVTGLTFLNGASPLTGVVGLTAEAPLEVTCEDRTIEGVLRRCIVLSLADQAGVQDLTMPPGPAPAALTSVFGQFAGPCAGRPESQSCQAPEPIATVNAVGPDCDGVLTLEFRGCAAVGQVLGGGCGIVVDCGLGLAGACLPPQIPNSAGLLPGEYEPANIPPPPPASVSVPPAPVSESLRVIGGLPYTACFDDVGGSADFVVHAGLWQVVTTDPPFAVCPGQALRSQSGSDVAPAVYAASTAASRNVTVWQGFDVQSVHRRVTTELKVVAGPAGAKRNAGLVLNWLPANPSTYFLAEIDVDAQQFRVSRFNGTTFQNLAPAAVPGLRADAWYRVVATVTPTATGTTITAQLVGVTDPGVNVTITVEVSTYLPATGYFGLGTNRALAHFAYLTVEAQN